MSDALADKRRFWTFNARDEFNREGLLIEVEVSFRAKRFARALD